MDRHQVAPGDWPELPAVADWQGTYATVHMWAQIVGKIRTALTPPVNHYWHCTLYVTARGLSTSPIPYGGRTFEIAFDFIDHNLAIETSDGDRKALGLFPRSVAEFYHELMGALRAMGLEVRINTLPQEVPDPIRCDVDDVHDSYDAAAMHQIWRAMVEADRVFKAFRGRFLGKCSPVHFFWGAFDLAVTRFSGRRAPERPGADRVTRESYSHEVISCGFWPGSGPIAAPAFYAYAAPAPDGFAGALPDGPGAWNPDLGEYLLPYADVRAAADPDATLLDFLQRTYAAAADLAHWDRAALER